MEIKIPFYKMTISETARAGERVYEAASDITLEAFTVTQMLIKLKSCYNLVKLAQTKLDPKELTRDMASYDHGRENGLRAFKHSILAASFRKSQEMRDASALLKSLLRDFGWSIEKFQNARETDVMDALALKIKSEPVLKAAVLTVNADGAFAEMNEGNTKYKETEKARTELQANSSKIVTSEVCDNMEEACETIIQFADVMNKVSPNVEYQKFLEQVEIIAEQMNASAESRRGSKVEEGELSE